LENKENILLQKLIKGNQSAFDKIFKTYYKELCFFSLKIVKDYVFAEEVVQNIFINLWEKRKDLKINISLKAYLYRSVYNNSIHFIKKENLTQNFDEAIIKHDVEFNDILVQTEIETKIYNTIEELPEQCKKIFKMSRFDELKYREIAEKLNISIKTVETQMSRALKYLTLNLNHLLKLLIFVILNFLSKNL